MAPEFDRGVFVFSLDFELVWGSRDLIEDGAALVRSAEITRAEVFGPLLDRLVSLGICATWATVGHLFLAQGGGAGSPTLADQPAPQHAWLRRGWYDGVPAGDESSHPAWYGRSLVRRLVEAGQDVGSHSFGHPIFGDPGCSRAVADADLARARAEAQALGIRLSSFVFPRNEAGHLDLLARHGFTCWRPVEPVWWRHPLVPRGVARGAHFAAQAAGKAAPTVLPWRDPHGLWAIPASSVFLPVGGVRDAIPLRQRIRRCTAGIDRAAQERRVCHLYTHPINLADDPARLLPAFFTFLEHAARLRDSGRLRIRSMAALAEDCAAAASSMASR